MLSIAVIATVTAERSIYNKEQQRGKEDNARGRIKPIFAFYAKEKLKHKEKQPVNKTATKMEVSRQQKDGRDKSKDEWSTEKRTTEAELRQPTNKPWSKRGNRGAANTTERNTQRK